MGSKYDDSAVVELTGKIMVIAIIILFLVVLFVFFLHLYAKWFWYRLGDENNPPRRRRRQNTAGEEAEEEEVTDVSLGLDPIILKSIPVVKFNPKNGELECAVCLSELAAGENARLLPKCSHGFHVECIDIWFRSHSTCPLCRNPISILNQMIQIPSPTAATENQSSSSSSSSSVTVTGTETPNFPTNVLFWGNENQVSTLGACLDEDDRRNRHSIQIPIQNPSPSSDGGGLGVEEDDSKSPLPARMRSFKRLLSRDRRVNPSNVDLEQGSRSSQS